MSRCSFHGMQGRIFVTCSWVHSKKIWIAFHRAVLVIFSFALLVCWLKPILFTFNLFFSLFGLLVHWLRRVCFALFRCYCYFIVCFIGSLVKKCLIYVYFVFLVIFLFGLLVHWLRRVCFCFISMLLLFHCLLNWFVG